jgi:hypothetical protein
MPRYCHSVADVHTLKHLAVLMNISIPKVGVETAPMLGVRASPSGRYILVLLRAAPSEVWTVSAVQLTRQRHSAGCPVLSPEGTSFAVEACVPFIHAAICCQRTPSRQVSHMASAIWDIRGSSNAAAAVSARVTAWLGRQHSCQAASAFGLT